MSIILYLVKAVKIKKKKKANLTLIPSDFIKEGYPLVVYLRL